MHNPFGLIYSKSKTKSKRGVPGLKASTGFLFLKTRKPISCVVHMLACSLKTPRTVCIMTQKTN